MKGLKSIFDRIFTRYVNTGLIFLLDVFLSCVSAVVVIFVVQYLVTNTTGLSSLDYWNRFFWVWLAVSTVSATLMLWIFKCYRIVIRHASLADIYRFVLAIFCASLIDGVALVAFGLWHAKTWLILLAYFLLNTFLLISFRVLMIRTYEEVKRRVHFDKKKRTRVLIYNTSEKSISLVLRLLSSPHYDVVGFLTPFESENNLSVQEIPVYSFNDQTDVMQVVDKCSVSGIVFPEEPSSRSEMKRFVAWGMGRKLELLIAPVIDDLSDVTMQSVRDVRVEDLLGRDDIVVPEDSIQKGFAGKVVLVTGAAGTIGSELCRQLAHVGVKKLILFDNAETSTHNLCLELEIAYPTLHFVPVIGDVRQQSRLDYVFNRWHPQVVFHAAHYKHVPLMEVNPCEAVRVNVVGTRLVADSCAAYGAEMMVLASSDKAVNPVNIVGCSKRMAEIYVQSMEGTTRFVTVRIGNVLGASGSVIPRFRQQIEQGGPVTVTDPQVTRYFMTASEACRLMMVAATLSAGNDVYVLDMGEPIKITTIARRMIKMAGLVPGKDIKIEYIGLRPGDKIHEELLFNRETTDATSHECIRRAHVQVCSHEETSRFVDALEQYSTAVQTSEVLRILRQAVPEFNPVNPDFTIKE